MNISIIKKINEKMPYWMKRPFTRIIRERLINNSVFKKEYQELCKADVLSQKERETTQLSLLRNALNHAYNHSPFYKKVFDENDFNPNSIESVEDIKRLPILTKENLKRNLEEIVTDDITDSYVVTTGGTTGEPTKIMMDKDAIYREWAFIYHYWSKYGYDYRTSRLATFRGVDMDPYEKEATMRLQ